jgi:hypothetical protein
MGTVVFAGVDAPLVSSLRKKTALADRFEEVGDAELALVQPAKRAATRARISIRAFFQ